MSSPPQRRRRRREKRPADVIDVVKGWPAHMPSDARVIACLSHTDLGDGLVRRVVLWLPDRCPPFYRAAVRDVVGHPDAHATLDAHERAAWQFFVGGPEAVGRWSALSPLWTTTTRKALGFCLLDNSQDLVSPYALDSDSSSDSGSDGGSASADDDADADTDK